MAGLRIGPGGLDGKGVYAARGFAAGEAVVDFELQPLTREQFRVLAQEDRQFVHSYGGQRWLYPPPARWVNHSDRPSCYEDFESSRDVALRDINPGEAITIDATQETARELSTFLEALLEAQSGRDHDGLARLLAESVVLWEHHQATRGPDHVAAAFAAVPLSPSAEPEWQLATGRWEALCSIECADDHVTLFLRVVEGNWQLVYGHRSDTSRPS